MMVILFATLIVLLLISVIASVAAVADHAKTLSDIRGLLPILKSGYASSEFPEDYLHFAITELKRIGDRE